MLQVSQLHHRIDSSGKEAVTTPIASHIISTAQQPIHVPKGQTKTSSYFRRQQQKDESHPLRTCSFVAPANPRRLQKFHLTTTAITPTRSTPKHNTQWSYGYASPASARSTPHSTTSSLRMHGTSPTNPAAEVRQILHHTTPIPTSTISPF
jgi:hypothetical protein